MSYSIFNYHFIKDIILRSIDVWMTDGGVSVALA